MENESIVTTHIHTHTYVYMHDMHDIHRFRHEYATYEWPESGTCVIV